MAEQKTTITVEAKVVDKASGAAKDIAESLGKLKVELSGLKIDDQFAKSLSKAFTNTTVLTQAAKTMGANVAKSFVTGLNDQLSNVKSNGRSASSNLVRTLQNMFKVDSKGIGTAIGTEIGADVARGITDGIAKAMKGVSMPKVGGGVITTSSSSVNKTQISRAILTNMLGNNPNVSDIEAFMREYHNRIAAAMKSEKYRKLQLAQATNIQIDQSGYGASKAREAAMASLTYQYAKLSQKLPGYASVGSAAFEQDFGQNNINKNISNLRATIAKMRVEVDVINQAEKEMEKKEAILNRVIARANRDAAKQAKMDQRLAESNDAILNRVIAKGNRAADREMQTRGNLAKRIMNLTGTNDYSTFRSGADLLKDNFSSAQLKSMYEKDAFEKKANARIEAEKKSAAAQAAKEQAQMAKWAQSLALKQMSATSSQADFAAQIKANLALPYADLQSKVEAQKQLDAYNRQISKLNPTSKQTKTKTEDLFGNALANFRSNKSDLVNAIFGGEFQIPSLKESFGNLFSSIGEMGSTAYSRLTDGAKLAAGGALGLVAALTGVGFALKSSLMDVMTTTEKFRGFNIALLGMVKTQGNVDRMMESSMKVAENLPVSYEQVFQTTKAMSLIAPLRPLMTNPRTSQKTMEDVWQIVQTLATIEPEWGQQGAMFSLREMMSGDFLSLKRRFEMPVDTFKTESGKSLRAVRNQPGELLRGLAYNMESLMPKEALEATSKQLGPVLAKILGYWEKFKSDIGNAGIYDVIVGDLIRVQDYLKEFMKGDSAKEYAQRLSDAFERGYHSLEKFVGGFVKLFDALSGSKTDFDSIAGPLEGVVWLIEQYARGMEIIANIASDPNFIKYVVGMWDEMTSGAGKAWEFISKTFDVIKRDFLKVAETAKEIIEPLFGELGKKGGSLLTPEIAGRGLVYMYLFGPGNIINAGFAAAMVGISALNTGITALSFAASGAKLGIEAIKLAFAGVSAIVTTLSTTAGFTAFAATVEVAVVAVSELLLGLGGITAVMLTVDEAFTNSKIFGWAETVKQAFGFGSTTPEAFAKTNASVSASRGSFLTKTQEQFITRGGTFQNPAYKEITDPRIAKYIEEMRSIDPIKNGFLDPKAVDKLEDLRAKIATTSVDLSTGTGKLLQDNINDYVDNLMRLEKELPNAAKAATNALTENKSALDQVNDVLKKIDDLLKGKASAGDVAKELDYALIGGAVGSKSGGTENTADLFKKYKVNLDFAGKVSDADRAGSLKVLQERSGDLDTMFAMFERNKINADITSIFREKSSTGHGKGTKFDQSLRPFEGGMYDIDFLTWLNEVGSASKVRFQYEMGQDKKIDVQRIQKIIKDSGKSLPFVRAYAPKDLAPTSHMDNEFLNDIEVMKLVRESQEETQKNAMQKFWEDAAAKADKAKAFDPITFASSYAGKFMKNASEMWIEGSAFSSGAIERSKKKMMDSFSNNQKTDFETFAEKFAAESGGGASGGGQGANLGSKLYTQINSEFDGAISLMEDFADRAEKLKTGIGSSVLERSMGWLGSYLVGDPKEQAARKAQLNKQREETLALGETISFNKFARSDTSKNYREFLQQTELDFVYGGDAVKKFNESLLETWATWAGFAKLSNSAKVESDIKKMITLMKDEGKSFEEVTKKYKESAYEMGKLSGSQAVGATALGLLGAVPVPMQATGIGMSEDEAKEMNDRIKAIEKLNELAKVGGKEWAVYTTEMQNYRDEIAKLNFTRMDELIAKYSELDKYDRATRAAYFKQYETNLELAPQSISDSWKMGMQDSLKQMKNWSEMTYDISKGVVGDLQSTFQTGFFDFMSQKTKNLGDMFRQLGESIKNNILQVLSKLASRFVIDLIFNTSGSSSGGGGGNFISSVLSMFSGGGQQQSSGGGFNVGNLFTAGLSMFKGGSSAGDLFSTAANWISGAGKSGGKSSGGLWGLAQSFLPAAGVKAAAGSKSIGAILSGGWAKAKAFLMNPATSWIAPVAAAGLFLSQPGRLFGGHEDHTGEARAAQAASANTWNDYVAGRSKYAQGYSFAGRENINALMNYSFPQGQYYETESGGGLFSKHTHTGHFDDSVFQGSLKGYYDLLDKSAKTHFKAQYDLEKLKEKNELAGLQREIALKQEYFDIINKMYQDAMKAGDWATTNDLRDKVYEAQNDLWKLGDSLLDLAKAATEAKFSLENYINTGRGTAKILYAQNELGELRNRFNADMAPSSSTIRANILSGGSDLSGELAAIDMQEGPKLIKDSKEWYERKLEILEKEKELSDMIYAQVTGYQESISANKSSLMGMNLTPAQRQQFLASTNGMYGLQNSSMFGNVNYTKNWTTQEVNPEYQNWINRWNASGDGGVSFYNNIAEQIATWASSPIGTSGPNGTQTDMEKFLTWAKITVGGEMVEKNLQTDVTDGNYDPTNVNTALSSDVPTSKEAFLNFLKNPQYMSEVLTALGFGQNVVDFTKQFTRDASGMLVSTGMTNALSQAGIAQNIDVQHSAQERVKTWGQFTQSSMFAGMSEDEKKRFMYITQVQRGKTDFDASISYKDFAAQANVTEMVKNLMNLSGNDEIIDWEAVGQYWTDSIKRQLESANIQSLQNDISDMWSEMMMQPYEVQSSNVRKLIQKINETDKDNTEYWEMQKQLASVQIAQAKEVFGVVSSGAISGASKIGVGGTAYYGGAGLYEAYLRLSKENPDAAQSVYEQMQDSMVGYNNRRDVRRNMSGMTSSAIRMLGNSAYLPTKFSLASRDINWATANTSTPDFLYQQTAFGNVFDKMKGMSAGQREDYSYQQDLLAAQTGASNVADLYRRGIVDKSKMEEAMKVIADLQMQRAAAISSQVDDLARSGFATSDQLNAIGMESGSSQLETLRKQVGYKQLFANISGSTANMSDRAMSIAYGMGTIGSINTKAIQPYGAFSDVLRAEYGKTSGQRADYLYQQSFDQVSNALKVSTERFGKGSDEYNSALQNFSQVVLDRASQLGGALDELLTTGFITKEDIAGVNTMAQVEALQLKARQGAFQGGILGTAGSSSLDTGEIQNIMRDYASLTGINGTQTKYYQSFGPGRGEWRTMNRATSMAGMEANAMLNFYNAGDQTKGGAAFADFYDASAAYQIEQMKVKIKNSNEGSTEYFDAQNELFQLMIQRAEHLKQKAEESSSKIEDMLNSIDETMKLRIAEERKSNRGDVYFIDMGTRSASQQLDDLLAKINTNDPAAAELVRKFREKMAQNQSASR